MARIDIGLLISRIDLLFQITTAKIEAEFIVFSKRFMQLRHVNYCWYLVSLLVHISNNKCLVYALHIGTQASKAFSDNSRL